MPDPTTAAAIAAALGVAKMRAVRTGLLPVHRVLLDVERARYEHAHGYIEGAQEALRLVMSDPWFAWIRPLSALIVQIDERLADDTPVLPAEVAALRAQTVGLLQRDLGGEAFRDQYQRALQDSPELIVVHGHLMTLLRQP